jgi:VanZ family protein
MKATDSKTKKLWTVSAGILLTLVVLLAHQYLPNQISDLAHKAIRSLHGPGFGAVALLMMLVLRSGNQPAVAYIKAGAFSVVLAGLSEAAQIPGPREAQISDLLVDGLGILGFLGTAAVFDRGIRATISKRRATLLSLICIPAFVLTLMPTSWLLYALVMRTQALPQILSFDEKWEQTYSSGVDGGLEIIPAPTGWPEGSGNIARLRSAGRWGLMLHIHPHPDWSDYSAVSFVAAASNEESRRIALGLWGINPGDGSPPGRYYTVAKVWSEPARYCILFDVLNKPSSQRKFELTQVYELLVGATKDVTGIEVLVDDFRLEKDPGNCPSD